jgi:hypothetical protein
MPPRRMTRSHVAAAARPLRMVPRAIQRLQTLRRPYSNMTSGYRRQRRRRGYARWPPVQAKAQWRHPRAVFLIP